MTLEARLAALATAVGTDVKTLSAGVTGPAGPEGPAGPVGNASALTRTTTAYTTALLADGATETGLIPIAPSYQLLRIQTNVPSRVRLYASTAQRDADVARVATTDPTGDHGLLFEFMTTTGDLDWALAPMVDGYRLDTVSSSIPITITNLSGSSAAVTVTLTYIPAEGTAGALQGPVGPAGSSLAMPTYVTSLPGTPVDGQEVYYRIADGVVWHLRYKAAIGDGYKWEFIGGAHLKSVGNYSNAFASAGSWQDGAQGAFSLTAPRPGIYDVEWGCGYAMVDSNQGFQVMMGVSYAGAAVIEPITSHYSSATYMQASHRMEDRVTLTAATTAVALKQQVSSGGPITSYVRNRYLALRPVRLS